MIKIIKTTYIKKDTVSFIIDNDSKMSWLAEFDSSNFERFFVVIDEKVKQLWGKQIIEKLKKHKKQLFIFEVKATENSKSLQFYPKLIKFLENNGCNLSDLVIAVGGGIIIDLVSFSCSTYMRALPFYAVPTTLIGQIDASTAGKTCLNTDNNKNLLGTFYYPLKVYNNMNFLKTNSQYHLRQGYSEIFKYGLLGSSELIELMSSYLKNPSEDLLIKIMQLAIGIRIRIRKINPLASNLGHTFGHAIEKISNFEILHGDAISSGTVMSLYFAEKIGIIGRKNVESIINKMKKLKLNIYVDKVLDINKLVDLMMRDKKSSSTWLNLVLIAGISKPYSNRGFPFYRTSKQTIKLFLKDFMKKYPYKIRNCASYIRKNELMY